MSAAPRLHQSLDDLEDAFATEMAQDRARQEALRREAERRTRARRLERVHKRGTWRFVGLVLVLVATAVLVTVAMFQTLYLVMG